MIEKRSIFLEVDQSCPLKSSGSLAIFAAIRRASSRVISRVAARRPGSSSK